MNQNSLPDPSFRPEPASGGACPHRHILLIDDDPDIGEIVALAAEGLGIPCTVTTNAGPFLAAIGPETSLLFLDLVMPEIDGIELLRTLSQRPSTPPIVLMSGIGKRIVETAHTLAESLGLTVAGHLNKPFRIAELEALLNRQTQTAAPHRPRDDAQPIQPSELADALSQDQFVLHYQPQIELCSGAAIGVEALVRWRHPTRGLVFPDAFIPLAESLGLIDQLGWLVAARGLSELNQFSEALGSPLALHINVSVQSLRDLSFPDRFLALARHHRIPPEKLVLEITETGLIQELSSSLDVLTRLRMNGVQLSIDDFGTGYSMMNQLRNIPATEIKIDKSFVQNLDRNDSDRILVQKTIEIGRELGLRVIAEGVEDRQQLAFLREYRCDCVQGYFYSKPLPPPDIVRWLAAWRASPVFD